MRGDKADMRAEETITDQGRLEQIRTDQSKPEQTKPPHTQNLLRALLIEILVVNSSD